MNDLKIFKEQQIKQYLENIDLDNIDTKKIQRDLKALLGEEPAVRLNYKKETMIMEDGRKTKPIETLESVSIIYTYDTVINGQDYTLPAEEKFIIN